MCKSVRHDNTRPQEYISYYKLHFNRVFAVVNLNNIYKFPNNPSTCMKDKARTDGHTDRQMN